MPMPRDALDVDDENRVDAGECFFRDLNEDSLRDGSFQSVRELTGQIETYLAKRNLDPQPYRWRAKGEQILAKAGTAHFQWSTEATAFRRWSIHGEPPDRRLFGERQTVSALT
jgi:hypothetical protein